MFLYFLQKFRSSFGLDYDENNSTLPPLKKTNKINGTTEYWHLKKRKFFKVGYLVANISSELGKFVYLDKDGISQYNLAPFDELYESEKSFKIDRS